MNHDDEYWMAQALGLAEKGRGHVEPNPLVGSIVVKNGEKVGEGWHEQFGKAHAEVNALARAGAKARGGTLYVTLEPCCHHGKTPPCTRAILEAGIARVVAALPDPFPEVAGKGAKILQEAGLDLLLGVMEPQARFINMPYLKLQQQGRPYVHAKWAMTLDGKLASTTGDSQWISNEASRQKVHTLRRKMDAIMVGLGTALVDNPLLTARPAGPRQPTRIVLDNQCRLPITSQLVQTARECPTLVACSLTAPGKARKDLEKAGCEVLAIPEQGPGLEVEALLDELGHRKMTNILVEGGAELLGTMAQNNLVDEWHVFIAPTILGGRGAKTPVGGTGRDKIAEALTMAHWEIDTSTGDLYIRGWAQVPKGWKNTSQAHNLGN